MCFRSLLPVNDLGAWGGARKVAGVDSSGRRSYCRQAKAKIEYMVQFEGCSCLVGNKLSRLNEAEELPIVLHVWPLFVTCC